MKVQVFQKTSPQKIFKDFIVIDQKVWKHSGLGLNIVKNIVELHKGTIAASNRLNTKELKLRYYYLNILSILSC